MSESVDLPTLSVINEEPLEGSRIISSGHLWTKKADGRRCYLYRVMPHMRNARARITRMAQIWSLMSHRNTLPLLGLVGAPDDALGIALAWTEYRTVLSYLEDSPKASLIGLVSSILF